MSVMKGLWETVATVDDRAMWNRWGALRFLSIQQAADLLSGREPNTERSWSIPSETEAMRLRITQCVLLGELSPLQAFEWPPYSRDEEPEPIDRESIGLTTQLCTHRTTITTTNLAEWAEREGIMHGWKLPSAAKPANVEISTGEYPEAAKAEIEALKARAESAESQLAELDASPFSARERNNMLRIIRALSEMAALPERGSAAPVELQLQKLGFTGPKGETIRKVLADAARMEPDRKP